MLQFCCHFPLCISPENMKHGDGKAIASAMVVRAAKRHRGSSRCPQLKMDMLGREMPSEWLRQMPDEFTVNIAVADFIEELAHEHKPLLSLPGVSSKIVRTGEQPFRPDLRRFDAKDIGDRRLQTCQKAELDSFSDVGRCTHETLARHSRHNVRKEAHSLAQNLC